MAEQGIPLERISSLGDGTLHSRIGPGKVGSGVGAGPKPRERKEGETDGIKKMPHHADGSGPTHQRGREPEQSLTSDREWPQASAADKQPLSGSAPNGTRRAIQEPTDNTLVEPVTGDRVQQKAPPGLSQRAEFWERYDKLADIIDKKLSENLNGNLDVLLIFVSSWSRSYPIYSANHPRNHLHQRFEGGAIFRNQYCFHLDDNVRPIPRPI